MPPKEPSAIAEPDFDRARMVERLASERFDVLVVGGGITGAGVALDAASRGLRVALVEAGDFAAGTSSKSSKLVHGGIRYLQQGDVRLVYQALRERKRLRRNAPHLVKILPFLLPIMTKDGLVPRRIARALGSAMWLYDLTGGWRIGKLHKRISADDAHKHVPSIPRERLAGAYVYFDATVDDARLVLTVIRTAAAHGAAVANRCRVTGLDLDAGGQVRSATIDTGERDTGEGDTGDRHVSVDASVVVNATGVWTDEVRALASGTASSPEQHSTIRPAKGIHITVPWRYVRNDIAAVIPVPGDKRSLFVVPWGSDADGNFTHTYIGTTDTDYDGRLDDPPCTADDIDYVLGAVNATIDGEIARDDVTGVWAGLRPLVKSAGANTTDRGRTADLSRRHRVTVDPGGVVAIGGGKLTTYREMAEDTIDVVVDRLEGRVTPGTRAVRRAARWLRATGTRNLELLGAAGYDDDATGRDRHLGDRYGSLRSSLDHLVADDPSLGGPLIDGLPYERAEAVYAVRYEMATTLTDVLARRTRCHLLDRAATVAGAPEVAELLAKELDWDHDETARQLDNYRALVAREIAEAGDATAT